MSPVRLRLQISSTSTLRSRPTAEARSALPECRRRSIPRYNRCNRLYLPSIARPPCVQARSNYVYSLADRCAAVQQLREVRVSNEALISIADDDESVREATRGLM